MDLKRRLVEYVEDRMNEINLGDMFEELLESSTINKSNLILYVECLFYKEIIDGSESEDKCRLSTMLTILNSEDTFISLLSHLYMIYECERIRKKSMMNIYI